MSDYLGDYEEDAIVYFQFTTCDSSGAAVAPSSAFENADLKIFKNNSDTEKTAVDGITMVSPFNATVGLHAVTIDTSNDTNDAGFWVVGADYEVVLNPDETVDGQTIVDANKHFSIQNRYPTVANTRDALLDRPLAGNHDIAGSAGKKLQGIAEFTMA